MQVNTFDGPVNCPVSNLGQRYGFWIVFAFDIKGEGDYAGLFGPLAII